MAKQCIYCGRPLAKDDARFCNDCGRSQVVLTRATPGAAAPSAIKVKLPPKEYTRDDLSSGQPEIGSPGPVVSSPPVVPTPREQGFPPSSRMPKRPTRLKPPAPSVAEKQAKPEEKPLSAEKQAKPEEKPLSAEKHLAEAAPASQPTPAEEASTMVLPNWREELAQLRKEQEQARADSSVASEKKAERAATEPPPLPRRAPGTLPSPNKVDSDGSQTSSPRAQPNTPLPRENARSVESPWRLPNTPQPQNSARPVEAPRRVPNTPLPPQENERPTEASRRELHVKVWEPETAVRSSPPQEEKPEPGPAPAIEQNPFASAAFDAEEPILQEEALESVTWQAPLSPLPASRKQPPAQEEPRQLAGDERQPAQEEPRQWAGDERQPAQEEPRQLAGDERQPARDERSQARQEEMRQPVDDARAQPPVKEDKAGIEDLPTVPLAVPEISRQEPQIKVERASTPAPKKWAAPRAGNVEDLPTQPMVASASASATPRPAQQSSAAQTQSGASRLEADQAEFTSPSAQRAANPSFAPGVYNQAPVAQPASQAMQTGVDPLASRARTAAPASQPGLPFDPASLPPLPQGPLSAPGNIRPRAEAPGSRGSQPHSSAPFPDVPGQRPSVADAPPPLSASAQANTPIPAAASARGEKKPRKKRHTGRLVVLILLVLVLVGGGVGAVLNRDWITQYFQTPAQNQPYQTYQNSTLGVSLAYTQGWSVKVDQAQSVVYFADSSHTGQANLALAPASGLVGNYLNQQAVHLGITGSKAAPTATIGGSSWQAVQGTATQSGATYTAVLYATQHNGHFYTLEFLAPQASFTHIDKSDFIHMRSSFTFI